MKNILRILSVAGLGLVAGPLAAQDAGSYKVLATTQLMGNGGIDYVYADNDGRRVYVPRGPQTQVFDLDGHQYIGAITNISGHGVAIDTATHHGFSSSPQIGMFDTETMQKLKSITVTGRPNRSRTGSISSATNPPASRPLIRRMAP